MARENFYKLLGLARNASAAEIKKAYRRLARKYHPDTAGNNPQAAEKFKQVQEAYDVLSDTKKRQAYDRFGHAGLNMNGQPFPGGGPRQWKSGSGPVEFDLSDLFGGGGRRGAGGVGSIFDRLRQQGQSPGGFGTAPGAPARGADIEHKVYVSFDEAIHGTSRDVVATIQSPDGRQKQERITVKIPPGVDQGSKVRVRGKGQPSSGGNNGDLIIKVEVQEHKFFRRDGSDIHLDVPVTVTEAALGAKIDVPTLAGTTTVTIPHASSSGRKLRLKEKGLRNSKSDKSGDMYLTLKIVLPEKIGKSSRELLKKFNQNNPQDDIRKHWK
ncbi:MAG: J domain-containing protein [Phycisphaerae bacterium]|nr:J domain-containing protein [Phycisphaerae bacterium]